MPLPATTCPYLPPTCREVVKPKGSEYSLLWKEVGAGLGGCRGGVLAGGTGMDRVAEYEGNDDL